ncbi:single-stranded DNA-binding protein [Brevibacterium sp. HMSC07C04]|uniref:single-stranded DNA-binding protein n=1 Tax=Brevibacterium sp. HMSC07C04 TaxID=1581130 RepID=UPI0008A4B20E|nr:single-stranded DNA-binding protein [Brevibacterium sp. HMSC07C04]OFS25109.1 hypothetical protein HMPREF3162_09280 [Brevibacterium sp. HMSC07C04]
MQHYTYLVGNVGSDIRSGTASNGSSWASFRLAVNDAYRTDDGSYVNRPTTWYDVKVWRSWALNVAGSLQKGQRVIVIGRVSMEQWENESGSGERLTVNAHAVGPDLAFGMAVFRSTSLTAKERERMDEFEQQRRDSPWSRVDAPVAGSSENTGQPDETGNDDGVEGLVGEPEMAAAGAASTGDDGPPF